MRLIAILLVIGVIVGCGARKPKAESTSSPAMNADPKGNLEKIWLAWRTCESKNNFAPEEGGMFDKYLKELGDPREILKGIGIRWAIDTRKVSNRQTLIAWQEVSKDGKYILPCSPAAKLTDWTKTRWIHEELPLVKTVKEATSSSKIISGNG